MLPVIRDPLARDRMPAPSPANQRSGPQQQLPEPWHQTTLVAGIAMLITQMQAQVDHSDLVLTTPSGIGPLTRRACFHEGLWQGFDVTHSRGDPRSRATFGKPARPPMDQERSLRFSQASTLPARAGQQ